MILCYPFLRCRITKRPTHKIIGVPEILGVPEIPITDWGEQGIGTP